jgi:hypothetical protein
MNARPVGGPLTNLPAAFGIRLTALAAINLTCAARKDFSCTAMTGFSAPDALGDVRMKFGFNDPTL